MRSRNELASLLQNPGIIAIIRADRDDHILDAIATLAHCGVRTVEITLTTPGALGLLRSCKRRFPDLVVGAGSVINEEQARHVIEAGAEFIVTPILRTSLIALAHAAGRPVVLGAFTPTEAQLAHEAGADFIKIFPADSAGPDYIKALLAPLPHLRLVPTGGVNEKNAGQFFKAGAAALGVGSSLISAGILRDQDWDELSRRARLFLAARPGSPTLITGA